MFGKIFNKPIGKIEERTSKGWKGIKESEYEITKKYIREHPEATYYENGQRLVKVPKSIYKK